jgi:4-amino-4-deoxy-L-arabinose transferase-like glycosyltransferase
MKWRSGMRILDWTVPVGLGLGLCLMVPLGTALEFGADEGYELMKALLVSLGHPLYGEFWNDQPPLHTELVAVLFRIFGPSAYVGRLLSVGFAMALVGALYGVVRRSSGRAAALVSVLLLVCSPYFMQLSVSVMLELPAMSVAMGSVWAWTRYAAGKGRWWLIGSGVLIGCALQVKLTAVVFGPALAAAWLLSRHRDDPESSEAGGDRFWGRWLEPAVWGSAAVAAFGVIALALYDMETVRAFWMSHFSEGTRAVVAAEQHGFRLRSMQYEFEFWIPAMVGVAVIGWRRRWDLLVPVVLLATVMLVHLWHRPYWPYYRLHFGIPMAWLGGVGIAEWYRALWSEDLRASWTARAKAVIGWPMWSMLVALVLTLAPENGWLELRKLGIARSAHEDPMVLKLRERAAQTRWVYADRVIYAFWAGLPVPPELAVVPHKRVWSEQITAEEVIECLERYRPEQVLLVPGAEERLGLTDYLETHYERDATDGLRALYLRRTDE